MGVDIAFYIEVQKQENWVRLHFKPQFETKEDLNQSYWDTDCYFCRYYHFTNFLDEAASHIRGTHRSILLRSSSSRYRQRYCCCLPSVCLRIRCQDLLPDLLIEYYTKKKEYETENTCISIS